MKIRPLVQEDRGYLYSMLHRAKVFTPEEINVAMELIDLVLRDSEQKDYRIHCFVNDQDQPLGYICFGPIPMTQGTYDLYWILVDIDFKGQGIGSRLIDFLEEEVRDGQGRMILADTSSIPSYEEAYRFYLHKGFHEVARIRDFYWEGNDRITFCKRII